MTYRSTISSRRYPIGAEPVPEGGVHFRVWAPQRKRVEVVFEDTGDPRLLHYCALDSEDNGYFSKAILDAAPGMRYRLRVDGEKSFPDPASRFQPEGPHGPSEIIDSRDFPWEDADWPGLRLEGQVLYECHIGTFTEQGTWRAAEEQLPHLRDLGITAISLLPVADFVGRFGWGYDGVNLYAPTRIYGRPDDLRSFINKAHTLGLGVLLDVVYNHLGPEGNYLKEFSPDYFSRRHTTDWGDGINFDGPESGPVREYFITNAKYWIAEYHIDGLRLDATQDIHDDSEQHVLAELTQECEKAAGGRSILIVAENEPQNTVLLASREKGGYGIGAAWNDDFHHSAIVAMTGRNEAYYTDYLGRAQEFVSAAKRGYLFQGQRYEWQKKRRGTPALGIAPARFIHYLDNHDQIANSGRGLRCHMQTSPGRYRAMTALLLLGPQTPMLFQGQEFRASSCFFYFADHREELAKKVDEGRAQFLAQFRSLATGEMRPWLPDPANPETFVRSKIDMRDRANNQSIYQMHKDLLRLRREDPVFRAQGAHGLDGAVLGDEAFLLRYFGPDDDDRLLIVNLGLDLRLRRAPEPLLAPPLGSLWSILWSSESPGYGGRGTAELDMEEGWWIPGHAAVALKSVAKSEKKDA